MKIPLTRIVWEITGIEFEAIDTVGVRQKLQLAIKPCMPRRAGEIQHGTEAIPPIREIWFTVLAYDQSARVKLLNLSGQGVV